jgi:hypothetical protein
MTNDNLQKKKQIDDVLAKHSARIAVVKQKRDKIVSDFLEILKEKKLEELRNSLKQL